MSSGQRESVRRIVLWDPSPTPSTPTRFLYGYGSSLGLFDWSPKEAEIKSVSNYQFQQGQELSAVKCLAWSSHSVYKDLVAAASTAGRIQLIRFGYPASSGQDGQNSLATPPVFNIIPRVIRPCHAIAFSPQEPHHLAVGADKARGDAGLNIWDVEMAAKSLPLSGKDHLISPRPPERLQGRPTSSSDHRSEARVIYQHGNGEAITALAFLPQTPSTIIVGAGGKYTRVVDMRLPNSATGTHQIPNKFNSGLCVDPYDDQKFASFGEDAAIRVWDRRHMGQGPMLCFTEADAGGIAGSRGNSITTIAYSPSRRGILASLAADDSPVRLWSVLGGYYIEDPSVSPGAFGPRRSNSVSRISPLTDRIPRVEKTYFPLTLVKSQSTLTPQRLSNFCFATTAVESFSPHDSHILSVSKDGVLQVASVSSSPHHLWSPNGDLAVSHYDELSVGSSKTTADKRLPAEPWDIPDATVGSPPRVNEASNFLHTKTASSATEESRMGRSQRLQPLKHDFNFPPLPLPSTLSASRPPKSSRTYSPSGMRRFSLVQRTTSRTPLHSPNGSPTSKQVTLPVVPEPPNTSERRPVPRRRRTEDSERFLRSSPSPAAAGPRYCWASMEGDISMVMKRRVQLGYSMKNALDNATIARKVDSDGELLSEVWTTLSKFMDTLRVAGVAQVGGFDFTYQGLFGIWEGFPTTFSSGPLSDPALSINLPATPSPTPFAPQPQTNESPSVPNLTLPDPTTRPPSLVGVRPNRLSIGSHGREASSGLTQSRISTLVPDFDSAIGQLNQARLRAKGYSIGNRFSHYSLDVKSLRSGRRQLALALCDWDLSRDEFLDLLRKWESEGQTTRAACWASLIGEFETANEYLLRSNDDLLHVVAGTMSAILAHRKSQGQGSPASFELSPWRENCQRMITRLSDPYIRIMLSRLIEEPWIEILQDEAVRLTDRLGIIFRFLEDEKVSAALHATFENLKRGGELDGLLFTGITSRGMDLVQAYVDRTGDVQTAAILGSYVCPARFKDSRVEHWVEAYRDLLDQWKLFHFRCQFDIERGQMLQHLARIGLIQPTEWVERQLFIRCNYCSKVISPKQTSEAANTLPNTERVRTNRCPSCAKTLPRCVVCLMAIGISNDSLRDAELANETSPQDTLDEALVFCQTCRHGGHASHIFDWFFGSDRQAHTTCPVADCNCRCADL